MDALQIICKMILASGPLLSALPLDIPWWRWQPREEPGRGGADNRRITLENLNTEESEK